MRKEKLTWKDISIRQYLDIQNILLNKDIKDENKIIEIIPIIWPDIDPQAVPMNDVLENMNILNDLLNTEIKPDKICRTYSLGIFNKCLVTPVEQMTLSQFCDFQVVTQKKSDLNLVDVLACCIVPFGSKYNDGSYDLIELKEEIENMPITTAPAIIDFFVQRLKKLLKHFQTSLAKMIIQMPEMKMTQKLSLIWKMPTITLGIASSFLR